MSSLEPVESAPARKGPRHAAPRTRRRLWPRNHWIQAGIALVVVVALVIGGYFGYLYYEANRIHHIAVGNLSPSSASVSGTENVLMVGSTDRCALKVQNPAFGLCSQGVTGVNSDVIMVLHLDFNSGQVSILSIPRDTFIPNARTTGANKIDAALAEGPTQLVKAVEQDFAIPIQHFVELNFETFANVVNVLGGVNMYFPEPVYDAYSGLSIPKAGCVHLNGAGALAVVRARHLQYQGSPSNGSNPANWPQENLSDLARIRRNHEFLRVISTAMSKQGLGNPITDARLVAAVAPNLTTDNAFTAQHMLDAISRFKGVNAATAPQFTLPVITSTSYSYFYKGGNYGNVAFPINLNDVSTIRDFLHVYGGVNTLTNEVLPAPRTVTVSVANGSGTSSAGTSAAASLAALGFKIGGVSTVAPVGDPAETTVEYNSLNPSVVAAAQAVWHSLTGTSILAYEPGNPDPVTLVTGTTFGVLEPAVPTTTTTAPSTTTTKGHSGATSSTTSAPTTTTTSPTGFEAPNSATSTLEPWDPRSCTPSGGKGP